MNHERLDAIESMTGCSIDQDDNAALYVIYTYTERQERLAAELWLVNTCEGEIANCALALGALRDTINASRKP